MLTGLLALMLLWTPLPFGSVTQRMTFLLQLGAFVALALSVVVSDEPRRFRPVAWPAAALAAIAALGLLQSQVMPAAVIRTLSRAHAELASSASDLIGQPVPTTLSLAPLLSRQAALHLLAVAAALLAAVVVGRSRGARRVLGASVLAAALFQVLFGAKSWFARSTSIWGVEVPGNPERLRGTFVNPDHLSVFLEIALAVAFAWGWWAWRRCRYELPPEHKLALATPPVLIWLLLFTGLAFTGSRGGLAAAVVGAACQGVLVATRLRTWRLAPVGLLAAAIGIGTVMVVGLDEGLGRLLQTSPYEVGWNARTITWTLSLGLWYRFPALGTGLGTFEQAFPLVQSSDVPGRWTHAHNDYLELLVTTGVLGAVIALSGVVALLLLLGRRLNESERSEDIAAALAGLGAVMAVGVHEVVDFGLTIPATAFALAVVLGAAAARPQRLWSPALRSESGPGPA